jgi:hypothetical protein
VGREEEVMSDPRLEHEMPEGPSQIIAPGEDRPPFSNGVRDTYRRQALADVVLALAADPTVEMTLSDDGVFTISGRTTLTPYYQRIVHLMLAKERP